MYKLLCRIYQFIIKIAYYFVSYKEPILFNGENSIQKVPDIIIENGLKHPLVVIGKTLIKLKISDTLINELNLHNITYTIFDDAAINPTTDNVESGYEIYSQNNCDSIIALGGGSTLDTAKAIGAKAVKPNKDIRKLFGLLKIRKKIPLLIAIPTTSGTGSEATIASVIIDSKSHHKLIMTDPVLMPSYAILDPILTKTLPQELTAQTGMDALCHAVEAYTNYTYCTKKEKQLAKEAVKLIYENIYNAYLDGSNLTYRHNMQLAAFYAGRAFTRGSVGYVHAIGHTFSALYDMGHGLTMAIVLPKVLRKYGKKAERRLSDLAKYISLNGDNNHQLAENFISWIEEVNMKMGIPNYIEKLNKNDFSTIVNWAIKESNPLYPCPEVWKKKDFEEVLYTLVYEKK